MLPSAGVEASLGSLSSRDVLKTGWLGAAPLLIPFPPTRGTFVGKLVGGKYWGGKPLWSSRQLHISLHLLQRSHEGPIVNGLAICTGLGGEWFFECWIQMVFRELSPKCSYHRNSAIYVEIQVDEGE